jgi:hypothetical protein
VLNLRTGAALNATAGQDVIVNAAIDGRGGAAGGAVSLQAAHDVLINTGVVTNNGGIRVTAANAATMGAGTALASGTAAIGMTAGGDITAQGVSGGSLRRVHGGISAARRVIDGNAVNLTTAKNVTVNGPVLNGRTGGVHRDRQRDVLVNTTIDRKRGGAAGGAVSLQGRTTCSSTPTSARPTRRHRCHGRQRGDDGERARRWRPGPEARSR